MNLPPFYIGQKVVYITGIAMPKYSIHRVLGLCQFSCGCWCVDVGMPPVGNFSLIVCSEHPENNLPINGKEWFWASSFRPTEEKPFPLMTFTQIKEKEQTEVLINN